MRELDGGKNIFLEALIADILLKGEGQRAYRNGPVSRDPGIPAAIQMRRSQSVDG